MGKGSLQGFQDAIGPDSIFKAFVIKIYALTAERLPWIDISFVDMSPPLLICLHTQWQNSNILHCDKLIGIQPTQKANRNQRDPLIFPNIFFALFLKLLPIPLHQYFPLDIIKERLLYKSAISHPYPAMWVLSQKKGISKRNWLNYNFPLFRLYLMISECTLFGYNQIVWFCVHLKHLKFCNGFGESRLLWLSWRTWAD